MWTKYSLPHQLIPLLFLNGMYFLRYQKHAPPNLKISCLKMCSFTFLKDHSEVHVYIEQQGKIIILKAKRFSGVDAFSSLCPSFRKMDRSLCQSRYKSYDNIIKDSHQPACSHLATTGEKVWEPENHDLQVQEQLLPSNRQIHILILH